MVTERDLNLLDDYIGNRLKGSEKAAFEEKLRADAELASEYSIQRNIIESLRSVRAAELKTMLNNIPVSSIPQQTSWGKWAACAGAVAVIVAVWFGLKPDVQPEPSPVKDIKQEAQVQQNDVDEHVEEVQPETESTPNSVVTKEEAQGKTKPVSGRQRTAESTQPATSPRLDVYDPTGETEQGSESAATEENATVAKAAKANIPTEVVNNDKNFKFHYEFKNQRLILYGPFDQNLYEIMEFFSSENKRTMFLFYKNSYYLLNQAGEKVKPLSPVNDPVLLQKLKDSRGQ